MHIAALAASLAVLKKKELTLRIQGNSGTGGKGAAGRKEGGW